MKDSELFREILKVKFIEVTNGLLTSEEQSKIYAMEAILDSRV